MFYRLRMTPPILRMLCTRSLGQRAASWLALKTIWLHGRLPNDAECKASMDRLEDKIFKRFLRKEL